MSQQKTIILILAALFLVSGTGCSERDDRQPSGEGEPVRLMTLNPGHFHAALIQKNELDRVDETVFIYAPEGPDLDLHLERIEGFNSREEEPTNWKTEKYTGQDYLQRMLEEQPGNVMVTAGNNMKKTNYIKQAVSNGIHVLSDKPMAIDTGGWQLLTEAFEQAENNEVLLYDIMTERREVTSRLLRSLMQDEVLFGELATGTPDEPAIYKQSIHHLYKQVAGSPLRRPPWYFDIEQQGAGIVDVTVHLVDLSMWVAFPEQVMNYEENVEILEANSWPTMVTLDEFQQITGIPEFPDYLRGQLDSDGVLPLYSNGDIRYKLNNHHVHVEVQWDYEAPPGGDDSHFTIIRGSRANLVVRQGKEQDFQATVYVEPAEGLTAEEAEPAIGNAVERLQDQYPGAGYELSDYGWKLNIPDEFHYGHEAHFGMVAQSFLDYLEEGELPEWEVPNMITKYFITTQAREMAEVPSH